MCGNVTWRLLKESGRVEEWEVRSKRREKGKQREGETKNRRVEKNRRLVARQQRETEPDSIHLLR